MDTRSDDVPEIGADTLSDVESLRARGLAAYAYATLPAGDPRRDDLRGDYLAALARHQQIKRELVPLLAAWNQAGVPALLFKGFHLAEWVYPAPGMRFHGDVDVAVRAEDASEAVRIAVSLGWEGEVNSFASGRTHSHGVCNLRRPEGATQVDLQRFVIHSHSRMNRVQRRVTAAVWSRSQTVRWEGVEVHLPDPVDALLILALQRSWGDRWGLKPHDALDVRLLAERAGSRWRETLGERARALGCARTLGLFLERCDPERGTLGPAHLSPLEVLRRNLAVVPERPTLWIRRLVARARIVPAASVAVPAGLVRIVRARQAVHRQPDIARLLAALTPVTPPGEPGLRGSLRKRVRTVRGIRWAMRLLPRGAAGPCLIRSLAIYTALRRQGWPVEFVSGVRRTAGGVTGHAWVELEGQVLPELGEPHNRRIFRANVRYPGK